MRLLTKSLIIVLCSTTAATVDGAPNLMFQERIYDFGFAGQNSTIARTFRFTNTGDEPLLIRAVKSSCGCTVAVDSADPFQPGSSGTVEVSCKTGRHIGQMVESIQVHSNDPDEAELELRIIGAVRSRYALDPESLSLGTVERGAPIAKVLRLVDLGEASLQVHRVEVSDEYFAAEVGRFRDGPLRGFLIQLLLKPDAPPGWFALPLTIHTNLPRRPRIDVPIAGNILGRIRAEPEVLTLGELSQGDTVGQRLRITSAGPGELNVTQVSVLPPSLQAQWAKTSEGDYEIRLTIGHALHRGPFRGRVIVHTTAADQPAIEVPVYGTLLESRHAVGQPRPADLMQDPSTGPAHTYITRVPVEEDTYLSAWMISRFIDPDARFKFVASDESIPSGAGVVFDLPDARAKWRRTHRGCTSEHVLADVKNATAVVSMLVGHVRKLERGSWLVSPNSETSRLGSWVANLNRETADPYLRLQEAFAFFDKMLEAGGRIPE